MQRLTQYLPLFWSTRELIWHCPLANYRSDIKHTSVSICIPRRWSMLVSFIIYSFIRWWLLLLFLRRRKKRGGKLCSGQTTTTTIDTFASSARQKNDCYVSKKGRKVIDVCPKVFNRWPLCRWNMSLFSLVFDWLLMEEVDLVVIIASSLSPMKSQRTARGGENSRTRFYDIPIWVSHREPP